MSTGFRLRVHHQRARSGTTTKDTWLAIGEFPDEKAAASGCRREEIGGLRWSEIDTEARTITLPRDRTKNGQEHVVPLSDSAMALRDGSHLGRHPRSV